MSTTRRASGTRYVEFLQLDFRDENVLGAEHGEAAIEIAERFLRALESSLHEDHSYIVLQTQHLAALYWDKKNHIKAETLALRAYAAATKNATTHPLVITSILDSLAVLQAAQGNPQKAALAASRAFMIKKEVLGQDHPIVIGTLGKLAEWFDEAGDDTQAEQCYRTAISTLGLVSPPRPASLADALYNLAAFYAARVRFVEADPLFARAFSIWDHVPPSLPGIDALRSMAMRLDIMGEYNRAEPHYRHVLMALARDAKANYDNIDRLLATWNSNIRKEPVPATAVMLASRMVSIVERAFGPNDIRVGECLCACGELYSALGDDSAALRNIVRALAIFEANPVIDRQRLIWALEGIGSLHDKLHEYEQAEHYHRRALELLIAIRNKEDSEVADYFVRLAARATREADPTQAETLLTRLVSLCETLLGPNHPNTSISLENLGVFHDLAGAVEKAASLYRRALVINEQMLDPNGPDAASVRRRLQKLMERAPTLAPVEVSTMQRVEIKQANALRHAIRLDEQSTALQTAGKRPAAINAAARALELRENAHTSTYEDVFSRMNSLAKQHLAVRDYHAAHELYSRMVSLGQRVLGPEHPDLCITLINSAWVCMRLGDYEWAHDLVQRALRSCSRWAHLSVLILGAGHQLYWLLGEYTKADEWYGAAWPVFEKHAVALYRATSEAFEPDEPAKMIYERFLAVLEKVGDPATNADLFPLSDAEERRMRMAANYRRFTAQAKKLFDEGNLDAAIPLAEQALEAIAEATGPDSSEVASAMSNLSLLYEKNGDDDRAEQLLRRSLDIEEKADQPNLESMLASLAALVQLNEKRGAYRQAIPDCERMLKIEETHAGAEHPNALDAKHRLAYLHKKAGDYVVAERLYNEVLAIQEHTLGRYHVDVAATLSNLGVLYREKGDYLQAGECYRRALSIREEQLGPNHPDVVRVLMNMGAFFNAIGADGEAKRYREKAHAIIEKTMGSKHPHFAEMLVGLAMFHDDDSSHKQDLLLQAIALQEANLGPEHPQIAVLLRKLADVSIAKKEFSDTETFLQRALTIFNIALGPAHPYIADIYGDLADLYRSMDDIANAILAMKQCLEIKNQQLTSVLIAGSDEQKIAYFETLRPSTNNAIGLHADFAPDDETAKHLALTTILNRKGQVVDAMAGILAGLRRLLSPKVRYRLEQLKELSRQYVAVLAQETAQAHSPHYRATVTRLHREKQELEAQLCQESMDANVALQPVSIEQVQGFIPEDAALVEFIKCPLTKSKHHTYSERYLVYVLWRTGEIAWVDLGDAAVIDKNALLFRRAMSRNAIHDINAVAREFDSVPDPAPDHQVVTRTLDELIMRPVRRLLGNTQRILLSPDGPLNLVPFGALMDENGVYLVERLAMTYLGTGRDLLRVGHDSPSRQGPMIVSAPAYDQNVSTIDVGTPEVPGLRYLGTDSTNFRPLHFAAREGNVVAQILAKSRMLTGSDATKQAIMNLAGPSVLHIATHGFFFPPSSNAKEHDTSNGLMRSGIALTGANSASDKRHRGILTAFEMSYMDLYGTKLVVLSACETGLGSIRSGDGVYGLRRAISMAGAETQVISLWSVDDAATLALMETFYRKLVAGVGRSAALRQTQIEMLRQPEYAHPYYWASFICFGNEMPIQW